MLENTSIPVHLYTSIPVHLYTSIPVHLYTSCCRHHATPVFDDNALEIDAPSSRWDLASRCPVDHICPSRPGVIPGLLDHPCTALVSYQASTTTPAPPWCPTRPPGPLPHHPGVILGLQDHSYTALV